MGRMGGLGTKTSRAPIGTNGVSVTSFVDFCSYFIWLLFYLFYCYGSLLCCFYFKTGSHYIALSTLELACYIDQVGLEPIEIPLPLFS